MATFDVGDAVNAVVSLGLAFVYANVGRLMWRRPLTGDARVASRAFGVFWGGFGVVLLLVALFAVAQAMGWVDLPLTVTYFYVLLMLIVIAIWGLVYYMLFLYAGNARLFWPIAATYVALGVATVYLITWMHPTGLDPVQTLTYERKPSSLVSIALGLSFTAPVLAAAAMYGTLYFRATGRTERFRIGLVSLSFLVWFGWSTLSNLLQLPSKYPGSILLRTIGQLFSIAGALAVLAAYRPPAWLRQRYGVHGIDEATD